VQSSYLFSVLGVACLTSPLFCGGNAMGQAPMPAKIDFNVIKKAWRERQEKYPAARLTYTIEYKNAKLQYFRTSDEDEDVQIDPATAAKLAGEYIEFREEIRLSIDGCRIRYQQSGLRPGFQGQMHFENRYSASNGVTSKLLRDKNDEFRHPIGAIREDSKCDAEWCVGFTPIVWTFGALDHILPRPTPDAIRQESAAGLDSVPHVVLETRMNDQTLFYWLDPAKDYSLVRFILASPEAIGLQQDCIYERSDEGCWVPVEWTTTRFDIKGIPTSINHARVSEYKINPTFAKDEFDITFPPGTVVSDSRPRVKPQRNPHERARTADYLVKEDGSEQVITPDERQASYEQILKTESGEATTGQPCNRRCRVTGGAR